MQETPNPPTPVIPSDPGPVDLAPVQGICGVLDALLRRPRAVLHHLHSDGGGSLIAPLLFIAVVASALYGVVVGTFSGGAQLWAAPLKITLGLLFCAGICLPSLYVFACLSGSQAKLRDVAGMAAGLIALTSLLLFSFAPIAWVFSQSTESVAGMAALHIVFWLIATYFGTRFVHNGMARLGSASGLAFRVWTVIFAFVCLQMMTAVRPIIGTAERLLPTEKKFFLQYWGETMEMGRRHTAPARRD
jgi:hypothetical protein